MSRIEHRFAWFSSIAFVTLLCAPLAFAQSGRKSASPDGLPHGHKSDEIVVRFRPNTHASDRATVRARVGGSVVRDLRFLNAEHLRIRGVGVEEAIERLRRHPRVEYAEPNYIVRALTTPNDPQFPQMYGLHNTGQTGGTPGADIRATQAWDLYTGDQELKVGVIDTGVDYNHPDLASNIWTNPGEIAGNGVDDDSNGYVDDVHGYDFAYGDPDPFDDHSHGTHVSGTIAAVGNNGIGVTGVNWRARIVAIKFLDAGGFGTTAGAIAAVGYAVAAGVRLTNNSWGGGAFSQGLLDAINAAGAAGQVFVAAAGNAASDNDAFPTYPASYNSPYIIAVAATDHNDALASFSNYGATSVHLGAPGDNILSTLPGGNYGIFSGTSMASPHVAGAVAFVLGRFPAMQAMQAKTEILAGVDPIPSLSGRVQTGGRLNLFEAVLEPDSIPPGPITNLAAVTPGSNTMGLAWTATGDDGNTGRAVRYEIRYSLVPITAANFATRPLATGPAPQPAGSAESAEVTGLAFNTTYYFAIKAFDEIGNAGPISNVPTGTTLGIPDITLTPASISQTLLTGATATQSLTVRNDGQGTLDFTVPDAELTFAQTVFDALPLGKGENDPRPGILGSGGPDGFGYRWVDSDSPGGPPFSWVDITGVGQPVPIGGDDAISGPIAMGMSFPFYGGSYNTVYVCTNGFITFAPNTGAPYSNQPLPGPGAPPLFVAPFWDDLYFPGTHAYTHFDGGRFIVSWVNVPHLSGGGPYTFQAILYPSGEIRYQFLSMGAPVNGSTTGMQNGTQSIGLNVAYNSSYAHNGLAVRLSRTPAWLTVTPRSGRVLAGQQTQLSLGMSALGLFGGDYGATVRVLSNDPNESNVPRTVTLHVIGAPDIAVNPASADFGMVFVGTVAQRTIAISNPGTDNLVVSGITTGVPFVTVAPDSPFTLVPGATMPVVVTYAPTATGTLSGALTIASNDPDEASVQVPLVGSGVNPPIVSVTPGSMSATVLIPAVATQTLTIHNTGGSPLNWALQVRGVPAPADSDSTTALGPFPRAWGADPRITAPAAAAIPVTPALVPLPVVIQDPVGDGGTVDLAILRGSGSGGLLQVQMDLATPVDPFNFGGYLSLDVDRNRFTGSPPTAGLPGQDIGVEYEVLFFWLPNGIVQLYTRTGLFVGSFPVTIGPQSLRFAIPLSYLGQDDGDMDVTGVIGTAFGPTDWFPANGHGTILGVTWLSTTPTEGVVPAGQSAAVTVTYDTHGLIGGEYFASLLLTGNDPLTPQLDVPVHLTAIGVPDIAASPASLDFGTLLVGNHLDLTLVVTNEGSDPLHIAAGSVSGAGYQIVSGSFPIPLAPGEQTSLTIRFQPGAPCSPCAGQLALDSNDPDEDPLVVPFTGVALPPPDIAVDPGSFDVGLLVGETTTRTLTIHNLGLSPLTWSISARAPEDSVPPDSLPRPGSVTPRTWQVIGAAPAGASNRSTPDPAAQAVRATWGAAGTGPAILLYADEATAPPGQQFSDLALQALGLAYTAHYNDPSGFGAALGSQAWDLVIVDHANFFSLGEWWSEIEGHVNGGGRVLISTFDVDGSHSEPTTLWTTLGLAARGDLAFPSAISWWDAGHPLFNSPETVPQFSQVFDFYNDDGDRTGVSGGAADPAGFVPARTADQAAIVVSSNRHAIVNSFIVSENQADLDFDGRLDAVELLMNEIDYLAGRDWVVADPAEGVVPPGATVEVSVLFDATELLGGDYYADLVVSSNDPDEPETRVPTHLRVTGVPDVSVEKLPVVVESSADFIGTGTQTQHTLAVAIPPPADGAFELLADGDFGFSSETATLVVEGFTIGTVGGVGPDCIQARGEFPVDAATLAAITADGVVHAVVVNSFDVNDFCAPNRHTVRLKYPVPVDGLDFGSLFVGLCAGDSLRVRNRGTDSLRVSAVQTSHPAFTVSPTSFVLGVGDSRTLNVTFCPGAPVLHQGQLTLSSNDPDTPTVSVNLAGTGLVPPDIAVQPAQVVASLPIPATQTRTLDIQNTGGSNLEVSISTGQQDSAATVYEAFAALERGVADPRPGILGRGGPDRFGYRWTDSDELGGPTFSWVDITTIGTPIPFVGLDQVVTGIPIGFAFPFYGANRTTVNACTHGWLSFTATGPQYFNQPLPGLGAPENLIAAFWDDLNFLAGGRAFYHASPTRFVLSYLDVPRTGGGGPMSFQIILYPGGRIVFQYLNMGFPTFDATVGIQNAARDDGVMMVFNAPYVHNSLAIQIQALPPFLAVSPLSGVVPPGGSLDVRLDLSTLGLPPGIYRETVTIRSNDPDEGEVRVPVVLNAGVLPDIAVNPSQIDFGTVFVGASAERTLTVRNTGTGVLDLSGASFTGAAFSLAAGAIPSLVNPGASLPLGLRFAPTSVCTPCTGTLALASDDPDENPLFVALSGSGVPPPDIAVAPDSLRVAGATSLGPIALTRTASVVVSNTGQSDLHYSVASTAPAGPAAAYEALALGKGEDDPRPGILGSGGPDLYGYRWTDSDSPGGPAFAWVDITGVGQQVPIGGDDAISDSISMGMSFPFYGGTFSSVHVSTNGFLTFAHGTGAPFVNQPLPNAGAPPHLLAPFWDDLYFPTGGNAYTHFDGTRFIVSWVGVPHLVSGGPYTFQAILYPSGEIRYQYLSMAAPNTSATLGMQNGNRNDGLTVAHNAVYVHDGLAVRFRRAPSWLGASPASGTIPPGSSAALEVRFDASGLADGDHAGDLEIASDDPDEPIVLVPCRFHVGVASATFDVDPNSLAPQSQGRWIAADLEPGPGLDPHDIALATLMLQRAVPVDQAAPISHHDDDHDGIPQARYKFDRADLIAHLDQGESVPIEVIGEIPGATWFQGFDLVRSLPPDVTGPGSADVAYFGGTQVPLSWTDPPGRAGIRHDLWYSLDDGATWTLAAGSITGGSYLWPVPVQNTEHGMLELFAFDDHGALGSWFSHRFRIVSGTASVDDRVPAEFALRLSGPSPCRGSAALQMALPRPAQVHLAIYDVQGRRVREIAGRELEAGWHPMTWNGAGGDGVPVPSGVYFARMTAAGRDYQVRFVLLR